MFFRVHLVFITVCFYKNSVHIHDIVVHSSYLFAFFFSVHYEKKEQAKRTDYNNDNECVEVHQQKWADALLWWSISSICNYFYCTLVGGDMKYCATIHTILTE